MSRTNRPRRPTGHDYRVGELVTLTVAVGPSEQGDVVQIVGFRGNTLLRLLPIAGIPFLASNEVVVRTGLSGSNRPPRRYRPRRPRPRTKPHPGLAPARA